MTVTDALGELASRGINAVPVQTLRELAARDRLQPTVTVSFERRERDGWENECFAPSWFAFDGARTIAKWLNGCQNWRAGDEKTSSARISPERRAIRKLTAFRSWSSRSP
jgi:hypothetical protein